MINSTWPFFSYLHWWVWSQVEVIVQPHPFLIATWTSFKMAGKLSTMGLLTKTKAALPATGGQMSQAVSFL